MVRVGLSPRIEELARRGGIPEQPIAVFLTVLLIQRNLSHAERNEFWIDRRVVTRLQDSATACKPHRGVMVLGTKLLQAAEGGDECG